MPTGHRKYDKNRDYASRVYKLSRNCGATEHVRAKLVGYPARTGKAEGLAACFTQITSPLSRLM